MALEDGRENKLTVGVEVEREDLTPRRVWLIRPVAPHRVGQAYDFLVDCIGHCERDMRGLITAGRNGHESWSSREIRGEAATSRVDSVSQTDGYGIT